jgi:BirA family transcriptional regulator, biotin operon repressor / biotin---[acetyl-CoA-carboxylase] ligase
LAVNLQAILEAPIVELDSIDSTNNYAMRLIDADTAQAGLTIVATMQTNGKGQRGNHWRDTPSESLLMSIIIAPVHTLRDQFVYNACVTVAIAEILQNLCENIDVRIKWPNDVIINDKKAGGVLIENVLRGNEWSFSIIGIGLNILQAYFPAELPNATSIYAQSGKIFDVTELGRTLRAAILQKVYSGAMVEEIMKDYNDYLYRRFLKQRFTDGTTEWDATVLQARQDGQLEVQLEDGRLTSYTHGIVGWKW